MSKNLINNTLSPIFISDVGVSIPASSTYTIPPQDYLLWAASSNVVTQVGSGNLTVNDGSYNLSISDGIDLIKGLWPKTIKTLAGGGVVQTASQVTSVASGVLTTVTTYSAAADGYLVGVRCTGTNIAKYQVLINSNLVDMQYTNFGSELNCKFDFGPGINVYNGDTVTVKVLHNRPYTGDFHSTILVSGA